MRSRLSRREILAAAAALAGRAGWTAGTPPMLTIDYVKATPVTLTGEGTVAQRLFGKAPEFSSDFDPARWRWRGPFPQLTGAIIVEIRTKDGISGFGLGAGGGAAAYIVDHHLKDLLLGAHPLNIELLWDQLFSASSFYGRKGVTIMALSAIDLALWDIAGKAANRPVYELLGGATKDRVPVYFTGFDVEKGLQLGCNAFKLPIRHGPPEGAEGVESNVRLIREAREKIGPDRKLMIDCIGLWNVPYTLDIAKKLAPYNLYWIEEPLLPDDLEGYQRLCREIDSTNIASGEHEYTRYGFRDLLHWKAADILQPDITWCGGLTEIRKVVTMAEAEGIPLIPHRGGSLCGLPLILANKELTLAESFGIGEQGNDLMEALTPPFENGYYLPPKGAGLGSALTSALVEKFAKR